ncbi:hypothetical protein C8F01DRAFT_1366888 [Mycena amicta]|nr:hypothetical protein C8F01DRAFT_1366888 [Mycena amicta]
MLPPVPTARIAGNMTIEISLTVLFLPPRRKRQQQHPRKYRKPVPRNLACFSVSTAMTTTTTTKNNKRFGSQASAQPSVLLWSAIAMSLAIPILDNRAPAYSVSILGYHYSTRKDRPELVPVDTTIESRTPDAKHTHCYKVTVLHGRKRAHLAIFFKRGHTQLKTPSLTRNQCLDLWGDLLVMRLSARDGRTVVNMGYRDARLAKFAVNGAGDENPNAQSDRRRRDRPFNRDQPAHNAPTPRDQELALVAGEAQRAMSQLDMLQVQFEQFQKDAETERNLVAKEREKMAKALEKANKRVVQAEAAKTRAEENADELSNELDLTNLDRETAIGDALTREREEHQRVLVKQKADYDMYVASLAYRFSRPGQAEPTTTRSEASLRSGFFPPAAREECFVAHLIGSGPAIPDIPGRLPAGNSTPPAEGSATATGEGSSTNPAPGGLSFGGFFNMAGFVGRGLNRNRTHPGMAAAPSGSTAGSSQPPLAPEMQAIANNVVQQLRQSGFVLQVGKESRQSGKTKKTRSPAKAHRLAVKQQQDAFEDSDDDVVWKRFARKRFKDNLGIPMNGIHSKTADFARYESATAEEVDLCSKGRLLPAEGEYKWYLGPGYFNAKWNQILVAQAAAQLQKERADDTQLTAILPEVPDTYVAGLFMNFLKSAAEAYHLPQPRFGETSAQAQRRAEQYTDRQLSSNKGRQRKKNKHDKRKKIVKRLLLLAGNKKDVVQVAKLRFIQQLVKKLGVEGMSSEDDKPGKLGETISPSPAPTGLPRILYDEKWLAEEIEIDECFEEELEISEEAFEMLEWVAAEMDTES